MDYIYYAGRNVICITKRFSGADPGFPVGGAPTLQEGAPTYDIAKNFQKTA